MTEDIAIGATDIMKVGDNEIEFFRPGTSWADASTGPKGNQYAGRITDAKTARQVAYRLLLWAEEKGS